MRTPERQLLCACLLFAFGVAHVDTSVGRGIVVSCCQTSALVLGRRCLRRLSISVRTAPSWSTTSCLPSNQNSFTFSLYEILSTPRSRSRFTFGRSASSFASSVDSSSSAVKSHLSSVRSLLTPSETRLSISPVQSFTFRHITDCDDVVPVCLSTYTGILN